MVDSNLEKDVRQRTTIPASIKEEQQHRQTYKKLIVSFILMMVFTLCSFYAVLSESIPASFAAPFIVALAILQVILQLVIFMHLDDKGSGYQAIIISFGLIFALAVVACLLFLIWW